MKPLHTCFYVLETPNNIYDTFTGRNRKFLTSTGQLEGNTKKNRGRTLFHCLKIRFTFQTQENICVFQQKKSMSLMLSA